MKLQMMQNHFLHALAARQKNGEVIIGQKEFEDAKRNEGLIEIERKSSKVWIIKAKGIGLGDQQDANTQLSQQLKSLDMGEVEWPEDEKRIDVIGSNGNDGAAYE